MNFNIVQFHSGQLKDVKSLIDQEFGKYYSDSKKFMNSNFFGFCLIVDSRIVGFASYLTESDKVCKLDLIVLEPEFRGKGLGKKLFEYRLRSITKRTSPRKIYLNHWVKSDSPIPLVAIKFGFEKKTSISGFWREESLTLKYECKECRKKPCVCTCDIYELLLSND